MTADAEPAHPAAGSPGAVPLLPAADPLYALLSSLLAAVGGPGADAFGLGPARAAVLLLVDGLGWQQLHAHAADAPYLSSLTAAGRPLAAGLPSSTAVSIASLGTGRPAGEHGVVGYTVAAPDGGLLNTLRWQVDGTDARTALPPERWQPHPTVFERAVAAGHEAVVVAPRIQDGSGLTRAALRGARFRPTLAAGDLVAAVAETAGTDGSLCYAYVAELDLVGHVHGPGSLPWRAQLRQVDALVATLAELLPAGTLLAVTGDHGMVAVSDRVDLDATPALTAGVALVAGEPRARHLHTMPGAATDVAAVWRERLAGRASVLTREEAVGAGWFGPRVDPEVAPRIGDVLAFALGATALVRRRAEPVEAGLAGHHGAFTPDEVLVPLLTVRR